MSMTIDEAVVALRREPRYAHLVEQSYLSADVPDSARRFAGSGEFEQVRRLLGESIKNAKVLDLGAGTGIASYAFLTHGARSLLALEPSPSEHVGRGAIRQLNQGLGANITVVDGVAENIPICSRWFDIVYARQVLHHIEDLYRAVGECYRVLNSGGIFIACREHVANNAAELEAFLSGHPLHRLAGGENAYPLKTYVEALREAGFSIEHIFGPWDSVINTFPTVRSETELVNYPKQALQRRFGIVGTLLATLPGVIPLAWRRIKRHVPGALYTFIARR